MLFVLKKAVSRLLFPLPLTLIIAGAGLLLLWFTERQRAGRILVTLGLVLLLLLSSEAVSTLLISPLEDAHPPYGPEQAETVDEQEIAYVVVLAGGIDYLPEYPITRQVGAGSMARLVEAVRVHRRCPKAKLVLSGGLYADPETPDDMLTNYRFVRFLGVDEQDIVVRNVSRDTAEEARNLQPILEGEPFFLVTSASHMPRAVQLFRAQGLRPIPAPTDYRTGLLHFISAESFYPSSGSLAKSERAIYEYLGMLWARFRGQM
jgi:uncharacterized SAM-binding protein YcdF (DUF218 family)